jgi:hypothetical protein
VGVDFLQLLQKLHKSTRVSGQKESILCNFLKNYGKIARHPTRCKAFYGQRICDLKTIECLAKNGDAATRLCAKFSTQLPDTRCYGATFLRYRQQRQRLARNNEGVGQKREQ